MNTKDLKIRFKKETGLDVNSGVMTYSKSYVNWLEKQLTIHSVVVPKGTFTAEQVLTELNKCKDLMDARLHFECEDL